MRLLTGSLVLDSDDAGYGIWYGLVSYAAAVLRMIRATVLPTDAHC
jgi:hypothetical protein